MTSRAHVLVVSPERAVLQAAEHCLHSLGHSPFSARSLAAARRTVNRVELDLFCFDSLLPGNDLERFWRAAVSDDDATPVLLFAPPSAKSVPSAMPAFFQPGRDGLVTKPIERASLTREVSRLLSGRPGRVRDDIIEFGGVVLDALSQKLLADDASVALTPTEFRLLRCLMQHPAEYVSADSLLNEVWGYAHGVAGPELVRAHVSNLRRKLRGAGLDPKWLRNVPFQGYGFVVDPGQSMTA
jgi:DNA-binding response OmpR family regulator